MSLTIPDYDVGSPYLLEAPQNNERECINNTANLGAACIKKGNECQEVTKIASSKVWNGSKTASSKGWSGCKTASSKGWSGCKTASSKGWSGCKTASFKGWNGSKWTLGKVWNGSRWVLAKGLHGGAAVFREGGILADSYANPLMDISKKLGSTPPIKCVSDRTEEACVKFVSILHPLADVADITAEHCWRFKGYVEGGTKRHTEEESAEKRPEKRPSSPSTEEESEEERPKKKRKIQHNEYCC